MDRETFQRHKLGIPELDDQHWRLCQLFEQVKFSKSCKTREDYLACIQRLRDAVLSHFKYEESLMGVLEFPFLKPHLLEHHRLKARIDRVISVFKASKNLKPDLEFHVKLIMAFQEIIITHIDEYDRQISTFINWKNQRNVK